MSFNAIINIIKSVIIFALGWLFVQSRQSKKEKIQIQAQLDSIKEYEKRKAARDALSSDDVNKQLQDFIRKD